MLYIASDHRGFELKKHLINYLKKELKQPVEDCGPKKYDQADDFTDFGIPATKKIQSKKDNFGILICGSGHGMCILANKFKGIRAILGYNIESTELGKRDDNANVLCLVGNTVSPEHAQAIVKKFLETKFDGLPRRVRRLQKITELEK